METIEETVVEISGLEEGPERQTARRSDLYRLLAGAFSFPTADLVEAVRSGDLRSALAAAVAGLPYPLDSPASDPRLADAGPDADTLEVEYIRLFDVGTGGGPPCALYGGQWKGDRLRVMEEAIRFYEHFGLALPDPRPELPDHLTVSLEFLHYLAFRETERHSAGTDPSDYARAQRDFLDRQVLGWFPLMAYKLTSQQPPPFYAALVEFALAFFQADRRYLAG
jgi:DMSO reductase family type II enzyme chaperone